MFLVKRAGKKCFVSKSEEVNLFWEERLLDLFSYYYSRERQELVGERRKIKVSSFVEYNP